ncbi:hypothetical protein ADUPG1_008492 [Aduncisulcus paluster]|uniref:Maturase K n=1 Tax=Aduncisulcus paluster TaxID=2918883 RepID=A0ABQ5KV57_9EUKA|nr:hypothetical protein ADUPG1_008492 [Aduncisulcus paluster]
MLSDSSFTFLEAVLKYYGIYYVTASDLKSFPTKRGNSFLMLSLIHDILVLYLCCHFNPEQCKKLLLQTRVHYLTEIDKESDDGVDHVYSSEVLSSRDLGIRFASHPCVSSVVFPSLLRLYRSTRKESIPHDYVIIFSELELHEKRYVNGLRNPQFTPLKVFSPAFFYSILLYTIRKSRIISTYLNSTITAIDIERLYIDYSLGCRTLPHNHQSSDSCSASSSSKTRMPETTLGSALFHLHSLLSSLSSDVAEIDSLFPLHLSSLCSVSQKTGGMTPREFLLTEKELRVLIGHSKLISKDILGHPSIIATIQARTLIRELGGEFIETPPTADGISKSDSSPSSPAYKIPHICTVSPIRIIKTKPSVENKNAGNEIYHKSIIEQQIVEKKFKEWRKDLGKTEEAIERLFFVKLQ